MTTPPLGRYGIWRSSRTLDADLVPHLEELGFGALWLGSVSPDLELIDRLLDSTESMTIASGIVNIFAGDAADLAAAWRRVTDRHPGRFLLGIGPSHPERVGDDAVRPYDALVRYLDELEAGGVPRDGLALAALGPRVLELAGERTAAAHPYFVTPEHSRRARAVLGAGPILAPEQRVVLSADPVAARDVGRPSLQPYLGLVNYRRNLLRLGYTEHELDTVPDDLVDDLVAWGDDATVVRRLEEHHAAGADHVAVQVLTEPGADLVAAHAHLARALGL